MFMLGVNKEEHITEETIRRVSGIEKRDLHQLWRRLSVKNWRFDSMLNKRD